MKDQIAALLAPVVARFDLELESVDVVPSGKRRLLRIVVDGDGPTGAGPLLDDIAAATKAISVALDTADVGGNRPYTLEVSSRGVDRPLERTRHWRRNRGRLVAVTLADGRRLVGRISSTADDAAILDIDGVTQPVAYAEVTEAFVQVELNRKPAAGEED